MKRSNFMKKPSYMKKTISIKRFIVEFGKDFSEHMKNRLMELEIRCVLTRNEQINRLDLKHVEHVQYSVENTSADSFKPCQKELSYGQLIVIDGELFYSENCEENDEVMQSPIIRTIYDSLNNEHIVSNSTGNAKRIDDSNIDHLADSILTVCPQVSQSYLDIMSKYL